MRKYSIKEDAPTNSVGGGGVAGIGVGPQGEPGVPKKKKLRSIVMSKKPLSRNKVQ